MAGLTTITGGAVTNARTLAAVDNQAAGTFHQRSRRRRRRGDQQRHRLRTPAPLPRSTTAAPSAIRGTITGNAVEHGRHDERTPDRWAERSMFRAACSDQKRRRLGGWPHHHHWRRGDQCRHACGSGQPGGRDLHQRSRRRRRRGDQTAAPARTPAPIASLDNKRHLRQYGYDHRQCGQHGRHDDEHRIGGRNARCFGRPCSTRNVGGSVAGLTTITGGAVTNAGTLAAVDNQAAGTFTNEAGGGAGAVTNQRHRLERRHHCLARQQRHLRQYGNDHRQCGQHGRHDDEHRIGGRNARCFGRACSTRTSAARWLPHHHHCRHGDQCRHACGSGQPGGRTFTNEAGALAGA